ncbi:MULTISPECIES: hypothetical protein [Pectobacterium]|uniref:hypothetical protein n=1 Tax=Pectobacterium TaxID=122277 RepID=UPI002B253948|nr:hypothetical protein [Pectobacterium versatile]
MSERKFITEFGMNMLGARHVLLQQENLDEVNDINNPIYEDFSPHIYFICRRPRITLVPESVKFTESEVTGLFRKQVKDKYIDIPFVTKNQLETSNVSLECEYPYTEFKIRDENNDVISEGKSVLLMLSCLGYEAQEHLDLEIIYIGQSFGCDGDRSAADRLAAHSTLQNIYAQAMKNTPDQEIWLILTDFEHPYLLISMDGRSENYGTTLEEDDQHINNVLSNEITARQRINFTEAALIRYFSPEYNKTYKDTFPSPAHTTYSECYDLDLNSVSVELQTDKFYTRVWSKVIEPDYIHFCTFPLHSKEERMYMFDIARLGGE